jgi:hypothetical protein
MAVCESRLGVALRVVGISGTSERQARGGLAEEDEAPLGCPGTHSAFWSFASTSRSWMVVASIRAGR